MTVQTYTSTGTSLTVSSLSEGTTYYFTITAYNGTTPGDSSAVKSYATTSTTHTFMKLNGKVLAVDGKVAFV